MFISPDDTQAVLRAKKLTRIIESAECCLFIMRRKGGIFYLSAKLATFK